MSSMLRVLGGDNVERALTALERIAEALETANQLEDTKQTQERRERRARAG